MYKSRIRRLEARVAALERVPASRPVKIEVSGMSVGENIKARRLALGMTQEKEDYNIYPTKRIGRQPKRGNAPSAGDDRPALMRQVRKDRG